MEQSIQRPCPAKAGHVVDAEPLYATKKKKLWDGSHKDF